MAESPPKTPLAEKSSNIRGTRGTRGIGGIRVVQPETLRLPDLRDDVFSRTPLPTHQSHILLPSSKGVTSPFQISTSTGPPATTHNNAPQPSSQYSGIVSPIFKPKLPQKQRLQIHKDTKTFSLVPSQSTEDTEDPDPQSPRLTLSTRSSYTSLRSEVQSSSITSCNPTLSSIGQGEPSTPAPESKIILESISNSPWNYDFVGGLRKVQKTPDLRKVTSKSESSPLPSLPEVSDGLASPTSHDLSTKLSFQSTDTALSTLSDNSNYKVYRDNSASPSEVALIPPSSRDSNYQLIGDPSPASSVIYRPQTATSENENYELHGDPSPSQSYLDLPHESKYSQESLLIPPLRSRGRRSNENLGYYKSRSRESLRTGSLTSISTVLSQQEAAQAIAGTGSLITLYPKIKITGSSTWADSLHVHPLRSHMNDLTSHQWSSQLSTVHSVSDIGSDRGSRSWSENNGRRSSGLPSTPSRHSRQMMSISSSLAQEEDGSRSDSIEPPQPAFARNGQRHQSNSSIRIVGDQDEYGDGITDMQDLRSYPSRTRLSGFFSVASSDNGRTNTMRSTGSSRANSLLSSTIPTWAKLYYGSGERRYLGAPGSSTEGTDSRANSFRSGSPNTDHFPLSIYSPRRRPREIIAHGGASGGGSLEITPAPLLGSDGRLINDPYSRRFRTWSMSSIWSPHLRRDRRATRQSIWEPPSVNWSTEGGCFGRRNLQIVMFIMGFILPLSWMVAAILPLPPKPMSEMRERGSNLDGSNDIPNDYMREFGPMDEARYESAKWWRGLNRWMSLVGLLIIAVVVVLIVLNYTEGW